ncbi:SDR family NAD(P)-dependent oxidoreductase [Kineococcus sp. LSe6-4]|uniref:SDR family NAD(P)-dependent oxidoreductase n=1 Tax=Kineococcus halophytocola TaxID=3234027 RepID=A0ABV4H342_9ACTN
MTTVLITGASRGMGAETVRRLATVGHTVFAAARHPDRLPDVPGQVHPLRLDVTDDASVARAAAEVEAVTGSLDVVVNNAGVPGTWAGPQDVGPQDVVDVFAVNVVGAVRVTHAFLPLLRRGHDPRLVLVSSGMGSLTLQQGDDVYRDIAHLPYPASKAALNMLAVQYAKALPDVLVTAVDPGLTATEFTGGVGHSVREGSDPIVAAVLDTDGPSGRFLGRDGVEPW